ncbi:hypothetical protein VPNG_10067 [Cytospora leucostoma]|uniref:GP-PDE domain-containing protein n=1 Tax=Cytospora leucostoma TaxID=1230097 RepID=A0A423VDP0_9PEZI|nr:hypothetical protein VPNG_10067 [Cytospora leucostoma]
MSEVVDTASDLRQRGPDQVRDYRGAATAQHGVPPGAGWTRAQPGINNGLPQAVAHRGYKANFPENTMGAFRGAVEVGAHAIETDVHLTKDGVVVLLHDPDLKRTFGVEGLVSDYDWAYLRTLKTLREPRQSMPRLLDLLEYLAEPGNGSIWIFLDIKIDDAPEDLINRIAETISAAPGGDWRQRIVLGCWTAKHLRLCHEMLPDFALAHTGLSITLAKEYLKIPNVAINIRQESLFAIGGAQFMKHCEGEGRPVYAWTVNKESRMEWCIENQTDCVITDDPRHYLDICRRQRKKQAGVDNRIQALAQTARRLVFCVYYSLVVMILLRYLRVPQRLGYPREVREELRKV